MRLIKVAWLALVLLLLSAVIQAQEDEDFTPSPRLVTQMDNIEQTTSEIRGLDPLEDTIRIFPTRADVIDFLNASVAGEENEKLFADAAQFYIAFDFLPAGTDLMALYLEFLGDQIAGYYDPETKGMNVVMLSGNRPTSGLPPLEQITYSHEYTHMLQDQHFDLGSFLDDELTVTNPDEAQARLSLVEGDATYVMNEFTVELTQDAPLLVLTQILIQGASSGSLTMPENIPAIIQRELLSPYLDGQNFIEALIADGGWERVNQAYTENPPISTEHILHPDRYLAGDQPITVELIPYNNELGEGWEILFERPLGEFYLREYLDLQLPPLDVIDAATGWGGDRYRLYYNADTDQRAWVMRLEWDTPQDAEQFAEGYTQFGDLRFETEADSNGCWSNEVDAICFVPEISLISYASTLEQALLLLEGQAVPAN